MKILKSPKKIKCKACKCKFQIENKDMINWTGSTRHHIWKHVGVICPICNNKIKIYTEYSF
jgi:hypothetical protein